jgi:hypothetical protein
MRKLILKEEQVKKLIDNLVTENDTPIVFSVDFQNAFSSGKYKFTPEYEKIVNDNIEKIHQYIEGKNIENFKFVISSGESQVPNPPGFEERGSLADARANVLMNYLKQILPKILGKTPEIVKTPPVIGSTPWIENRSDKNDEKYKLEQFVKLNIIIKTETNKPPQVKIENPNKGYMINVRGDESNKKGAFYFPKTLDDWKKITYDNRLSGFYANAEEKSPKFAQTTVNMNDDIFLKYWLIKAPDLKDILGPAYVRDPKNSNNFILK